MAAPAAAASMAACGNLLLGNRKIGILLLGWPGTGERRRDDQRLIESGASSGSACQPIVRREVMTASVHADQIETAKKPSVLDLDAAVHDHIHSGCAGARGGIFIDDAKLHPEDRRTDFQCVIEHRRHVFWLAEDIDDVDFPILRNIEQRCIDGLPEDLLSRKSGVDRNDVVTLGLHIDRGEVTRPHRVGR